MKKFKLLMGFLAPLIVLIVAVACAGGIFAAITHQVSVENNFLYERHIGSGTEDDPYLIYSIGSSNLNELADKGSFNFYAGNNDEKNNYFSSKNSKNVDEYNHFRLVQNIEMKTGESLIETEFNGYLHGYGRSIKVNGTLFESVGNKNANSKIESLQVLTNGEIDAPAGLVINLYSTLEDVSFNGVLLSTSEVAGGLVQNAFSGSKLIKCRNEGYVAAKKHAGGLVGEIKSSSDALVEISYSYNKGTVQTTNDSVGNYVGGLVGISNANLSVYDSYNAGKVVANANESEGGILGVKNNGNVNIKNTYGLTSGNGSNSLIASGSPTSSINNVGYNFADNSGTVLGSASSGSFNDIQNIEIYKNWNFAKEDGEGNISYANNWVMAFDNVSIGETDSTQIYNMFLPHLWYEFENVPDGETFKINYISGEGTVGQPPQSKEYLKKNSEVQIEEVGTLERYGYKFLGWSTYDGAKTPLYKTSINGLPKLSGVYSLIKNVSLYPVWEAVTYSLIILPEGGTWKSVPNGFSKDVISGTEVLETNFTIETIGSVVLPISDNISRTGFDFGDFKVAGIADGGKALSETGVELSVGDICSKLANGTYGSITLSVNWNGKEGVNYQVIYEVADVNNNLDSAKGEVKKYTFTTTGKSGSIFERDLNNALISLDGKDVKVYNADKTTSDLMDDDRKIVGAINDHFTIFDLTAKSNTGENQNYIEGDGTTVVTIQVKRKEYTISLEAGDNVSTVSVDGAITNPAQSKGIEVKAYYGVTLTIKAVVEIGYIFDAWKDLSGNTISGAENYDLFVDADNSLKAYATGAYTLVINSNNKYATIDATKLENFVKNEFADFDSYSNYIIGSDSTGKTQLTMNNRKLGSVQTLPLSDMLGNNTLFEINMNGSTYTATLVGFSTDKNADAKVGADYNPDLIVKEIDPDKFDIKAGDTVTLYAIWDLKTATVTFDLNNADVINKAADEHTFESLVPNNVLGFLGNKGVSSRGFDSRPGFTLTGWIVVESFDTDMIGDDYSTTELENSDVYGDLKIQAQWEGQANATQYTIKYKTEKLSATKLNDDDFELSSTEVKTNQTAGEVVTLKKIVTLPEGYKLHKVTVAVTSTAGTSTETSLVDGEDLDDSKKFTILGDNSQAIIVYLVRERYTIELKTSEGISSVQFDNPSAADGFVEFLATGGLKVKRGTKLNISATVKDGFLWKEWLDEAKNVVSNLNRTTVEVLSDLELTATTHLSYKIAFAPVIDGNMVELALTNPSSSNISSAGSTTYTHLLDINLTSGEKYSVNNLNGFALTSVAPLFKLKDDYNGCQVQTGWVDKNGNKILSWDESGNFTTTDITFTASTDDNIYVLYATWSEKEYTLDIDYDSDKITNPAQVKKVGPFKPTIEQNPTKTGYNFDGFKVEEFNGSSWNETEISATDVAKFFNSFYVTRDTKITALWDTTNTETKFEVKFEIQQSSGKYVGAYLKYDAKENTLDTSKLAYSNNIIDTEYESTLQTDATIDLEALSGWFAGDGNRLYITNSSSYDISYWDSADNEITEANVNVAADGSLKIVIRYDLKNVTLKIEIGGADEDKISAVGFNNLGTSEIVSFIGATVYLKSEMEPGYEITGWNYVCSTDSSISGNAGYYDDKFYIDVPYNAAEKTLIVTPVVGCIEYSISVDNASIAGANMASDASTPANIGLILGGVSEKYTIESSGYTLQSLVKTGYRFLGYTVSLTDGDGKTYSKISTYKTEITYENLSAGIPGTIISDILTGSYGNITLKANFIANTYNITFNKNGDDTNHPLNSSIDVFISNTTVTFGETVNLGYATTSEVQFGFKGWGIAEDGKVIVGDFNGNVSNWNYHPEGKSPSNPDDAGSYIYEIDLYAIWVRLPKEIIISGDVGQIDNLTVTVLSGSSNAKVSYRTPENKYYIYLAEETDVDTILNIAVTMVAGYNAKKWTIDSALGTYSTDCKDTTLHAGITHDTTNFDLDVTEWIKNTGSSTSKIVFEAEAIKYEITYELNYDKFTISHTGTLPGGFKSVIGFNTTDYLTSYLTTDSSKTRLLTPEEIDDFTSCGNLIPTGYEFLGWYLDEDCSIGNEIMYHNGTDWVCYAWTKADNGTVYAKWGTKEYTVELKWNYTDSSLENYTTVSISYGDEIDWSSVGVPGREGYTFRGWFKESSCTTQLTKEDGSKLDTPVIWTWTDTTDFVAYAKWEAETYKLFADKDHAHTNDLQPETNRSDSIKVVGVSGYPTLTDNINVTYDEDYSTLRISRPSRTGYTFAGWYILQGTDYIKITDENGYISIGNINLTTWNLDLGVTGDEVEIFAKWKQDETKVTVEYKFETLDGTTFTTDSTITNKTITLTTDNDLIKTDGNYDENQLNDVLLDSTSTPDGFYDAIGEEQIDFEFYYKNPTPLTDSAAKIVYADGELKIIVKYYRKRITLTLTVDDENRVSVVEYSCTNGLVKPIDNSDTNKEAVFRYGTEIKLDATLSNGVTWNCWGKYNGATYDVFEVSGSAIAKDGKFTITDEITLQAKTTWTEFIIDYVNCELPNETYNYNSDNIELTGAKRDGYKFVGYTLEVCTESHCDHSSCGKYYGVKTSPGRFEAKIYYNSAIEDVSLNITKPDVYVTHINSGSLGTVVVTANWEALDGVKFEVVLHEQKPDGDYTERSMSLYAKAGYEISVNDRNILSRFTAYSGYDYSTSSYTGKEYYIFNLKEATGFEDELWVEGYYLYMAYTDWDGTKYNIGDPLSNTFADSTNSVNIMGNGTSVVHIYKIRRLLAFDLSIISSITGSTKYADFENIILSTQSDTKLFLDYPSISDDGEICDEEYDLTNPSKLSEKFTVQIYYGGWYSLTVTMTTGFGFDVNTYNSTNGDVDLLSGHIQEDTKHTLKSPTINSLADTTQNYSKVEILSIADTYKIRINLNDATYNNGSTEVTSTSVLKDSDNKAYINLEFTTLDITSDSGSGLTLADKITLSRDGYDFVGYTLNKIENATKLEVEINGSSSPVDLVAKTTTATDYISKIKSVVGDSSGYLAVFNANWEAIAYPVEAGIEDSESVTHTFTFDNEHSTDPANIFKDYDEMLDAHNNIIANNKKFIGWFRVPQSDTYNGESYNDLVNKNFNTFDIALKQDILSNYLFGLEKLTTADSSNNIIWNLGSYASTSGIIRARAELSDLELYLVDNASQYINGVTDISDLEDINEMYAWYMDASFEVSFNLNLDSLGIPTDTAKELVRFDGEDKGVESINYKWKPNNVESQIVPKVNFLANWGEIIGWSLNDDGSDAFTISTDTNTSGNYYITNDTILPANVRGKTLFAVYEAETIDITYDLNLNSDDTATSDQYTVSETRLKSPAFETSSGESVATVTDIATLLRSSITYGGIDLNDTNYELTWKLIITDGLTDTDSTNTNFILNSDNDKEKSKTDWQKQYLVSGKITFQAVWTLKVVKIVYHKNDGGDEKCYKTIALNYPHTILEVYDGELSFEFYSGSLEDGIFVGWNLSSDAKSPDPDYNPGKTITRIGPNPTIIDLYAVYQGTGGNPFTISNICDFNYLAGAGYCGGEATYGEATYQEYYLGSFNYFYIERHRMCFEFTEDIDKSDSHCGKSGCTTPQMAVPNVLNSEVLGNGTTITSNGEPLFDTISGSHIENLNILVTEEVANAGIKNPLFANNVSSSDECALLIKNIHIIPENESIVAKVDATSLSQFGIFSNSVSSSPRGLYIENCSNALSMEVNNLNGGAIGAMFGNMNITDGGNITSIINTGDIIINDTVSQVGGLIGNMSNGATIKTSSNAGDIIINGTVSQVGGLIGYISGGETIETSSNTGDIIINGTVSQVGGLIGNMSNGATIKTSSNAGDIVINAFEKENTVYAGGLFGYVGIWGLDNISITECFNTGAIIDNSYSGEDTIPSYLGGFIGEVADISSTVKTLTIDSSYSTAKIVGETSDSGFSYAGGFVGYIDEENITLTNSYSMSTLQAKVNSGFATVNLGTLTNTNSYYLKNDDNDLLPNYISTDSVNPDICKASSDMQDLSKYSAWSGDNDICTIGSRTITTAESWVSKDDSIWIKAIMKVGGELGVYSLPRLWWEYPEGLPNDKFVVYYDKNDESAYLQNVEGYIVDDDVILRDIASPSIVVPGGIEYINDNAIERIVDRKDDSDPGYISGACSDVAKLTYGYIITTPETTNKPAQTSFAWWTKDNYNFVGFSLDPNGTKVINLGDLDNIYTYGDIILYSIWEPMKFKISYELGEGDGEITNNPNPTTFTAESETIRLQDLDDFGAYKFSHWAEDKEGNNKVEEIKQGTTTNVTLYAIWEQVEFTVTLDLNTDFDGDATTNPTDVVEIKYTTESFDDLNSVLEATTTDMLNSALKTILGTAFTELSPIQYQMFTNGDVSFVITDMDDDGQIEGKDKTTIIGKEDGMVNAITKGKTIGNFSLKTRWYGENPGYTFNISSAADFNYFAGSNDRGDNSEEFDFFASAKGYYFKQTADFEVDSSTDLEKTDLNGYYNGNNKTITFTNGTTHSLFMTIGGINYNTIENEDATITNLNINFGTSTLDCSSDGSWGLITNVLYGKLENISVSGTIIINGLNGSFGCIGAAFNEASIIGLKNNADTTSINELQEGYRGGIVGYIGKTESHTQTTGVIIKQSCNTGNTVATVKTSSFGGIAGYITGKASITECYNSGNITSSSGYVGGIAGRIDGKEIVISDCYNLGALQAFQGGTIFTAVAGIVGFKLNKESSVIRCYDIGERIAADDLSAGIIYSGNWSDTSVLYNYFIVTGSASVDIRQQGGVSKSIDQLQDSNEYSGWTFDDDETETLESCWVWTTTKEVVKLNGSLIALSLPRLWWEDLEVYQDGTEEHPYLITSITDFNDFAKGTNTGGNNLNGVKFENSDIYFLQVDDIISTSALRQSNLYANYNGGGFTISSSDTLFNRIGTSSNNNATLKNLIVNNTNFAATSFITVSHYGIIDNVVTKGNFKADISMYNFGSFASNLYDGGIIKNSINYVSFSEGSSEMSVGGFVGSTRNGGSLINCVNYGNLETRSSCSVGGLIGSGTDATIENCYNVGQIKGGTDSGYGNGGLVGESTSITIKNSYNLGLVEGGGLVGIHTGTGTTIVIKNSYFLSTCGASSAVSNDSTIAVESAQYMINLQNKDTYSGWTFDGATKNDGWIWVIAEITINGETKACALPRLWFEDLTIRASKDPITYPGTEAADPYLIASITDFNDFATGTNTGGRNPLNKKFSDNGLYFKQMADILVNDNWDDTTTLNGFYDGNGKTITFEDDVQYHLFENIGSNTNSDATLKNLNVVNEGLSTKSGIATNLYGTIDNVTYTGSALGAGFVQNICSGANLLNSKAYISKLYANGNVIGGFVRDHNYTNSSSSILIDKCYFYGTNSGNSVEVTTIAQTTFGFFIGDCSSYGIVNIKNSANYASISTSTISSIGGFIGALYGYSANFINCVNYGNIIITNSESIKAGGFVGYNSLTNININNSYNVGNIVANSQNDNTSYAGGFIGFVAEEYDYTRQANINYCYNLGAITGTISGGFVGTQETSVNTTIKSSYYYFKDNPNFAIGNGSSLTGDLRKTLSDLCTDDEKYVDWSFDALNDGWTWMTAKIIIRGEEKVYNLPRLWWEDFESGTASALPSETLPSLSHAGTEADPHQIASIEDFNDFANGTNTGGRNPSNAKFSDNGLYFKQVADIIVPSGTSFTAPTLNGFYDGNGKTFDTSALNSNSVLFNTIGNKGELHNLTVKNTETYDTSLVTYTLSGILSLITTEGKIIYGADSNPRGAMAASLSGGKIDTCCNKVNFVLNSTETSTSACVGGLVGSGIGTITNCKNEGNIEGKANYAGGIIGSTAGEIDITYSFNYGDICGSFAGGLIGYCGDTANFSIGFTSNAGTITGGCVGGLIGSCQYDKGFIIDSFNSGKVEGTKAGGFIGEIDSSEENNSNFIEMENCYNTGNIIGEGHSLGDYNKSGGFVGYIVNFNKVLEIKYCYNLGKIDGPNTYKYAFCGWQNSSANIVVYDSYYDTTSATGPLIYSSHTAQNSAKYLLELCTQSTYGWTFDGATTNEGWIWTDGAEIIVNGGKHTYALPRLWWEELVEGEAEDVSAPAGTGTSADPYQIASIADFNRYAADTSATGEGFANPNKYFKQTADITVPSGTSFTAPTLNGVYDGNGKTFTLTGTNSPLFAYVGKSSTYARASLTNLKVINEGSTASAGIVTTLYGTIDGCGFEGSLVVSNVAGQIGGIAQKAYAGAVISKCYNKADITETGSKVGVIGGIVGYASANVSKSQSIKITECYNWGNIIGDELVEIGGIVCEIIGNVVIKYCYNTGSLSCSSSSGAESIGGIVESALITGTVAEKLSPEIEYCYNIGTINKSSSTAFAGGIVGYFTDYTLDGSKRITAKLTFKNNYWVSGYGPTNYYGGYNVLDESNIVATGTDSKTLTKMTSSSSTYSNWNISTGTATSGWVWKSATITINGISQTVSLPRLWWEKL